MPLKKTSQLPLVVTKGNERIILSRLEAGRRLYNATLHEVGMIFNQTARNLVQMNWG